MIKHLFKLLQGISLALLCQACSSSDSQNEIIEFPLKQLTLVSKEGSRYMAYIDQEKHTAEISGIQYSSSVAKVHYQLATGATISPDPATLSENWPREVTLTVTAGSALTPYIVTLKDWKEEENGENLAPDPDKWQLAWADNFDGVDINWNSWSKTPRNISDWNNTMATYDELYKVKDGILTLWGIKNTTHPEDNSPYLTGGIWGIDKKSFRLGRIDIRAKFDCAQGFWPALWLLPQDGFTANSGDGELDIMEHLNFDDFAYQTLHSAYTNLVDKTKLPNHVKSPIDVDKFNVYSVEVHEDRVTYLLNNKEMYSYPRLFPMIEGQFPFYGKKEFYVILSAQLGGEWVGEVSLDKGPVKMEVDWVKVYQLK